MAEFNPTLGGEAPNFTGRSQGGGADTSFETLFSGIGQAIGQGVQTADTFVQNKIEDDSRYAFDSLNQEFGFDAGDYGEGGGGNAIPSEILQSSDGLGRLAKAQSQGKITQEYYHQRLASTMKGLRAKYPGYEKQVDDILAKVTGTRPANAFRDALFANINAAQAATANESDQFNRWAMQDGNIGYVTTMFPDFFNDPEKYASPEARAQIQTSVGQRKGTIQVAEDAAKLNSADKAVSGPAVSQWTNSIVQTHLFGAVQGAGIGENANADLLGSALADNVISPEEKSSILTYLQNTKVKARQDVLDKWAKGGFAKNFTRAEMNQMIDDSLADITQIEAFVSNDNVSQAAIVSEKLKAMQDQDTLATLEQSPELRAANTIRGISEAGADLLVDDIIKKNGGGLKFVDKFLTRQLGVASLNNEITLERKMEIIRNAKGKTGAEKEQILGQALNAELEVIASGKLDEQTLSTYVQNNYDDALDELFNAVDDSTVGTGGSQRLRLFQKMFDPKITKAIAASGNQEAYRQYMSAALQKAQEVPEFRATAASLGESIPWNRYTRVEYNPETNRMSVLVNKEALAKEGFFQRSDQQMWSKRLEKAAGAFNNVLNVIAPIMEANGEDELEGVKQFARNLALDLGGEHQKGFYWYINEALDNIGTSDPGIAKPNSKIGKAQAARKERMQEGGINPDTQGSWVDVSESTESIEPDPVGESVGAEPINYAPTENGSTPALDAIDSVTNWERLPEAEAEQLFENEIDFMFEDSESVAPRASSSVAEGLKSRGLPDHVVRGIVANFQHESGLNPDINERRPLVKGSRGGYGLAQWTGPRRRALERYADERGLPVSDLDLQLDFVMHELETTHSNVREKLAGAENAAQAAQIFLKLYEAPKYQRGRHLAYAKLK